MSGHPASAEPGVDDHRSGGPGGARGVTVHRVGDTGWLLELAATGDPAVDAARVLGLAARLREGPAGQVACDIVPAATTVLVTTTVDRHGVLGAVVRAVAGQASTGTGEAPAPDTVVTPADGPLDLPVVLDGPDLTDTADLLGMTIAQVRARVAGTTWTVAFGGFAPGFGYLVGGGLDVPRLAAPRPHVPAGSVALAGPYAGIYPRASPGGWRVIGRLLAAEGGTRAPLFDPRRDPPALLTPGRQVRLVHRPHAAPEGGTG